MPDLRSLDERVAELVREELERESVKVCCQDFEHCRTPCTVRADHWKAEAEKEADDANYWKAKCGVISVEGGGISPSIPWPHKPSEPQPSQVPPSSLMWSMRSKDPTVFTLYSLAVFTLGICTVLVAIAAWSVACR